MGCCCVRVLGRWSTWRSAPAVLARAWLRVWRGAPMVRLGWAVAHYADRRSHCPFSMASTSSPAHPPAVFAYGAFMPHAQVTPHAVFGAHFPSTSDDGTGSRTLTHKTTPAMG